MVLFMAGMFCECVYARSSSICPSVDKIYEVLEFAPGHDVKRVCVCEGERERGIERMRKH